MYVRRIHEFNIDSLAAPPFTIPGGGGIENTSPNAARHFAWKTAQKLYRETRETGELPQTAKSMTLRYSYFTSRDVPDVYEAAPSRNRKTVNINNNRSSTFVPLGESGGSGVCVRAVKHFRLSPISIPVAARAFTPWVYTYRRLTAIRVRIRFAFNSTAKWISSRPATN